MGCGPDRLDAYIGCRDVTTKDIKILIEDNCLTPASFAKSWRRSELTSRRLRTPVARGHHSGIQARLSLGPFATASSQIPSIELANRRQRQTTDLDLGCAAGLRVKFLDQSIGPFPAAGGAGRAPSATLCLDVDSTSKTRVFTRGFIRRPSTIGDASSLLGDFRRVVGLVFLATQQKRGGGRRNSAYNLFDELPRCRSLGWVFGAGFILHRRLVASTAHPQCSSISGGCPVGGVCCSDQ